jgi:hypothetical protein
MGLLFAFSNLAKNARFFAIFSTASAVPSSSRNFSPSELRVARVYDP